MATNVSYERGSGGYTFSSSEVSALKAIQDDLIAALETDEYSTGLGVVAYRGILEMISDKVLGIHMVPKPGVDRAVWTWIQGAADVNAARGFEAIFIREYTVAQYRIRGLSSAAETPEQLNQLASNTIARNLLRDILKEGSLPGIEGLGAIDAGAAASEVFSHKGVNDYAPWAGTLLFPFLNRNDRFYRDLLLTGNTVTASIPGQTGSQQIKYATGTYDLVASLQASEIAAEKAFWDEIVGGLVNLFGPLKAPVRSSRSW